MHLTQKIYLPTLRSCVILFFLGAVLASFGDFCHVASTTTSYPVNYRHLISSIPFWVPLQFGAATTLIGCIHYHILHNKLPRPTTQKVLASGGTLVVGYALSGLMPLQPWLTTFYLICLLGTNFYFLCSDRLSYLSAVLTALVGCTIEILLIAIGVFQYENAYQQLHSIPLWLPLLYMHASVTIASTTLYLN